MKNRIANRNPNPSVDHAKLDMAFGLAVARIENSNETRPDVLRILNRSYPVLLQAGVPMNTWEGLSDE
jgi:hypothetical protein